MSTILKERKYEAGYVVRTELHHAGSDSYLNYCQEDFEVKSAYTPEGHYIGDSKLAHYLCKVRGVKPEKISPDHSVCSIGFCEKEQAWYGWSHRAMASFGIGSEVRFGDSAYVPTNKEDFLKSAVKFWDDEFHEYTTGEHVINDDGVGGVRVSWKYTDKVPNIDIRGQVESVFLNYPTFGNGEWIAKTLEDAKQMAIDFAEGVS